MDLFNEIVNKLALIIPVFLAVGAGWKYLPVVKNIVNEVVIPVINSILGLLLMFAPAAHAGILGDVGAALSGPARALLAVSASVLASLIHDKLLKPWLPPSPYSKKA